MLNISHFNLKKNLYILDWLYIYLFFFFVLTLSAQKKMRGGGDIDYLIIVTVTREIWILNKSRKYFTSSL